MPFYGFPDRMIANLLSMCFSVIHSLSMNEQHLREHKKDLLLLLTLSIFIVIIFVSLIIIDNMSSIFQNMGSQLLERLVG